MLTSGTKIGGFLIGDLLGKGAMGEVYKGEQLSLKRPVAIKRIATHLIENEDMVKRFKREAQVLAKVSHPNVVGVIECEEFAGPDGAKHLLLIMELIEGGRSLKSHLGKPIDWRLATTVVHMAADGLAAAFEQHVVHRDIKPDNIMMTHKGIAKLVDFGLAKAAESTALTMQAAPMGTPLFMSPESCRGEEAGHASDLYSLGVSWFFMLTGRYPFEAANLHGLLYKHISEPPPPPTGLFDHVPAPIVQLVYQCLEKDPAKRPASAVRLVEAIEALPAQGLLLPRDARELVGAGHDAPHLGSGSTTAGTLIADKSGATAATMIQGASPAHAATVAGDLSPRGAVAQTVVSNLSGNSQAATLISSPTAQPGQTVPAAAAAATEPEKRSGGSVAVVAVVVLLLLGFIGWKLFADKPAPPEQPVPAAIPPKPVPGPATPVVAAQVPAGTPTQVPRADPTRPVTPTGTETPLQGTTAPGPLPAPAPVDPIAAPLLVQPPKPVEAPKPVETPKPEPPKPVEAPKPVEPPKPVDTPKPEPPKPVETPKPEPVKPVELPKLPPPDSKAFDAALAAKNWPGAKAASDALPEPLRGETAAKLAKTAGQQLASGMKEAKALYDQELYRESYARLTSEVAVAPYADPKVKDAFIRLADTIRKAAKAQENP